MGALAVQGKLRGEEPSQSEAFQVLVIGLFDGIGALRVAMELQGVSVIGYVSVEKEAYAPRVVESPFSGVVHYVDVTCIHEAEVKEWSLRFSRCNLVVVGAGPPCQGVSGLNSDRKGASRRKVFPLHPRVAHLSPGPGRLSLVPGPHVDGVCQLDGRGRQGHHECRLRLPSCAYRCREDDVVPSPEDVLDYMGAQQWRWSNIY